MPDEAPWKTNPTPDAPAPLDIPDYTLLRRIGRGSYGDVWLARSVTGVFRVIKVVQRSRFDDDRPYLRELEGISRFQAAVSGRPRQLALLHVGRNDDAGYFYYVMEPADDAETGSAIDPDRYVPLTLREMLKRRGRIPASECVQFALELARGLAVLHGENLIHRDIKPSNVIFVQRVPKLADVGLVASADATLTGVGTPGYLPPEGPGSAAADIYSLGKVIYEMATGMDQTQYPRIPRELADHPDAPLLREINGIILKACCPYPAERHPSVEALARDLELIQAGRSVVFYEEFRKRSRAILMVTATLAVVAGLAAALFVWRAEILQRANHQSRRALYRSDLAIAQLAFASGDLGSARSALARQIPLPNQEDLRSLEWAILAHSVRSEGSPLEAVPNPVAISKITVDPTGRWVAASFTDDRVGVWDLKDGRLARTIHNAHVLGGFLPDGRIVIDEPERAIRYESPEGAPESTSRLITGSRLRTLLPDGRIFSVTPDGDYIYKLSDPNKQKTEFQFNLSHRFPGAEVSGLDITRNGKYIAIGFYIESGAVRERRLLSINVNASKEEWTIGAPDRLGWILTSPDNLHFVANIGWLRPVIMRFDNSSIQIPLVGHTARVSDASYSPDGNKIATASADQTIRTWDANTGELLSIHQGLTRAPSAVSWLPDGTHIVGADEGGNIRVFTFPSKSEENSLGGFFSDLHGDITIDSRDQRIAVSKSTNSISIISTSTLTSEVTIPNLFQPIAFSEDDRELFAFSSDWSLWATDIQTKETKALGKPIPESFSVVAWSLSPDSKKIAMSDENGLIALIDVHSGKSQHTQTPSLKRVWGITFTQDSKEFWTGSSDGVIHRWSSTQAKLIGVIAQSSPEIQAIAVSPDSRWLVVSFYGDSSIRIFDLLKKEWSAPKRNHRRYVQTLFFADHGRRLLSAGVDGRIVVWSVPDFEEITSFDVANRRNPSGDEGIAALKLSPQEGFLAALTEDGHLQVWRAR